VFDLAKTKQVVALLHQGKVYAVSFSPNGRLLAVGGSDKITRVFSEVTGDQIMQVASPGGGYSVDFARESSRLAATRWDVVRVVAAVSGLEVGQYKSGGPLQVAVSIDGLYAVAVDSLHAVVYEVETSREVGRLFIANNLSWINSVALSRQGRYLAIGDSSGTHLFESATGKPIKLLMPAVEAPHSLAFSPDGRLLASGGGKGGTALVWNVDSGRQIATTTHGRVSSVSFDKMGNYLATGDYDQNARIFDVATSREIFTLPHGAVVRSVAFSADGRFLATGTGDGSARVFEVSSRREVARINHDEGIRSVGFVDGDRSLLVATDDTVVHRHLWRSSDLIDEACARLARNLSPAEWEQYLGKTTYAKTCPNLP
jgi:WD40 repeat protein